MKAKSNIELPIFEYWDDTPEDVTPPEKRTLKLAHELYIFCRIMKTNKVRAVNLATNRKNNWRIDMDSVGEFLEKNGLIN